MKFKHEYEDIIDLPAHVSAKHPHMSMYDRAAQFAAFAALNGHKDAIDETARLTESKPELADCEAELIDIKLRLLNEDRGRTAAITYFRPDNKKKGGACITVFGSITRFDNNENYVIISHNTKIPIEMIIDIEETEK